MNDEPFLKLLRDHYTSENKWIPTFYDNWLQTKDFDDEAEAESVSAPVKTQPLPSLLLHSPFGTPLVSVVVLWRCHWHVVSYCIPLVCA